jgi:hypothetical protein
MTEKLFIEILNKLDHKSMSINDVYNECLGKSVSYNQAEQFFYSTERSKRFELFIALYEASLKNNFQVSFRAFREAYCTSDNIYAQIKNSLFRFDIKGFIFSIQEQNIDFLEFMSDDEKSYYDDLPEVFTIYRGMNNAEYESKNYGVSWSLSKETAEKYIYFDKNNVQNGNGGLANIEVNKSDIITIFSVHGEKEIIYLV